jgi:protein-L-isoaspartate(D-aspartate) O-methyltransferase
MVETQIKPRGIRDTSVLSALETIPRHRFIPQENQDLCYRDGPVAIGHGQTISQPYIVALMSEALHLADGMKVLEIGTGSGYQTAVLSALGARVHSIEIRPELAARAADILHKIGAGEVDLHVGNGFDGFEASAPYERIIVTAAPGSTPPALLQQLAVGGQMLIPVGERRAQTLLRVTKTAQGFTEEPLIPVLFVPMTGQH